MEDQLCALFYLPNETTPGHLKNVSWPFLDSALSELWEHAGRLYLFKDQCAKKDRSFKCMLYF